MVEYDSITVKFIKGMQAIDKLRTAADNRGIEVDEYVRAAIEHELNGDGVTLYDYPVRNDRPNRRVNSVEGVETLRIKVTDAEYLWFTEAQKRGHDYSLSDYVSRRLSKPARRRAYKDAWCKYRDEDKRRVEQGVRRLEMIVLRFNRLRMRRYHEIADRFTGGDIADLVRMLIYLPEE